MKKNPPTQPTTLIYVGGNDIEKWKVAKYYLQYGAVKAKEFVLPLVHTLFPQQSNVNYVMYFEVTVIFFSPSML